MPHNFISLKPLIDAYIFEYLRSKEQELISVNEWGMDSLNRLRSFVIRGKAIRGSLVMFMSSIYGYTDKLNATRVAAAVELLHSGLLIHDDIIDNDALRRGEPSVFAQYDGIKTASVRSDSSFGKNMATCVGDLSFFLAYGCLETLSDFKVLCDVLPFISSQFSAVCIAQMQDISFSEFQKIPTPAEVLHMYEYKTGRYTFSLPMCLGATLAEAPDHEIARLRQLGIEMGVLFQMKDDVLNLYGTPSVTGKPVASDIRESKKTIFISELFEKANAKDKKEITRLLTRALDSQDAQKQLYAFLEHYNVRASVNEMMKKHEINALALIDTLHIGAAHKKELSTLVTFMSTRDS